MFFINPSLLWSFSFFFMHIYIITLFSIIIYSIPSIKEILLVSKFKNKKIFEYVTGFEIHWFLVTPLFLLFILISAWSSYPLTAWFGSLLVSSFQLKISYFITFFFFLILTTYTSSFYFSSKEPYDYLIVNYNFFFWIMFLFFSNTIFTIIFFIEITSTLIFLLIVTSTFSSTYFYNNLNLNLHNYFNQTTPFFFIQVLMYFFWISLISSLNLFFFFNSFLYKIFNLRLVYFRIYLLLCY